MKKKCAILLFCSLSVVMVAQIDKLRISEILSWPHTGGAKYIEVFNSGESDVIIVDVWLAAIDNDTVKRKYHSNSNGFIQAGEYVVFTTDVDDIKSHYTVSNPDNLIKINTLPSMPQHSGHIGICDFDGVIYDNFAYNKTMHSPTLHTQQGVALERRSMQLKATDNSNWASASSASGYGTPTGPNSQEIQMLFNDNAFLISDDIISPDNDGYQDIIDITYQLDKTDLNANITIFDAVGHRVRRILSNGILGQQGLLTWDGTDDNGQRCRQGNYLLLIETYNNEGRHQFLRRTITLLQR